MIVQPKVKGFVCITAHPKGCEESVKRQIDYVVSHKTGETERRFSNVLIIGASTGYGLSSRITAAFGYGAATLGVMYEKEPNERRTATPGFYNTRAFEKKAREQGLYAKTVNKDAFSDDTKKQVIDLIKEDLGFVDLVIYSLAAPRRTDRDGTVYQSVLKTRGTEYRNKNLNLSTGEITEAVIPAATEEECVATVKVMGGEDWENWIEALATAGVLAENAVTVAYSYLGPKITYPIYTEGTIGAAKKHLEQTADIINRQYPDIRLKAFISVNKGLVTQASSAIPVVPLYMSILYKVMKKQGVHEGTVEQMERLFREKLTRTVVPVDDKGRIRMDDYEMDSKVQNEVQNAWESIDSLNIREYADIDGYFEDFYHMFGFGYDTVDYSEDVDIM